MTFDIDTTLRLPLTSDGAAVTAAADTLDPETSVWSRGSSITLARDQLRTASSAGPATPTRNGPASCSTSATANRPPRRTPRPFDIDGQLVNGGAVLGYGTAAGGRMAITAAFENGDIVDPSTGQPALSVIDEKQLASLARQLGVPYLHRTGDDNGLRIVDAVQLKELAPLRATDSAEIVGGRSELGWVALLLVALLAAWEIGSLVAAASRSRRPARPNAPPDRRPPREPVSGWPPCAPAGSDGGAPPTVRQPGPGRRHHRSIPPARSGRDDRRRRPTMTTISPLRPDPGGPERRTDAGADGDRPWWRLRPRTPRRPRHALPGAVCASGSSCGPCRSCSCSPWWPASCSPWWPSATRRCARTAAAT